MNADDLPTTLEAMSDSHATPFHQFLSAATGQCLPWVEVMKLALYHPDHGYYAGKPRRVGRAGDFYTAVSVGPLYGQLLAQVAAEVWHSLGQPDGFTLIEQGAHDGQLAADIWQGWPHKQKPRYLIVEPQAEYREVQRARLAPMMGERVSWVPSWAEMGASPTHAMLLCNELLDAFPVLRVRTTMERTVPLNPLANTSFRQFQYVTECFGTIAVIRSVDKETSTEFMTAKEVRRLSL
jgi:SAM-dependent MidA family methyltransferase